LHLAVTLDLLAQGTGVGGGLSRDAGGEKHHRKGDDDGVFADVMYAVDSRNLYSA
jgi:hypothetical protein